MLRKLRLRQKSVFHIKKRVGEISSKRQCCEKSITVALESFFTKSLTDFLLKQLRELGVKRMAMFIVMAGVFVYSIYDFQDLAQVAEF